MAPPRPPLWRDVRVIRWVLQLVALAAFVAVIAVLFDNVRVNSRKLGIPTGYGFLDNPAQFPIPDSDFRQTQPIRDALAEGLGNTLRVSLAGIFAATVLGVAVGVARLSRNWLVRNLARVYVEALRNIPLLLLIVFAYIGLALTAFPRIESAWEPLGLLVISNRGVAMPWFDGTRTGAVLGVALALGAAWLVARWRRAVADRTGAPARSALWALPVVVVVLAVTWLVFGLTGTMPRLAGRGTTGGIRLSPEFFAIFFALVIYTASHIAEIVRGSIQAVSRGQGEAADALALSGFQRMWYVVLPQAMRIAVPPLGNQYLNLTKNSTLGAVVSYFELSRITSLSVGNGSPAVPSYLLTLGLFLLLSLALSLVVNLVNRRLAPAGR